MTHEAQRPPAESTPDFLMEKLIELLISELSRSEVFGAAMVESIRAAALSGELRSVDAVKGIISEPAGGAE